MYKRIWVLVEGGKDSRFVRGVLRPILEGEYDFVETWEYAERAPERIMDFLRSMRAMKADYLFLGDINSSPCVTAKKEAIKNKYQQGVELAKTIVVLREIESWYLAGVDDKDCREFGIPIIRHTENVTKEQFENLVPARFGSVVDFMDEILNRFHIDAAKGRNRSFSYLMDKLEAIRKKA
jgi:hypothetical protein